MLSCKPSFPALIFLLSAPLPHPLVSSPSLHRRPSLSCRASISWYEELSLSLLSLSPYNSFSCRRKAQKSLTLSVFVIRSVLGSTQSIIYCLGFFLVLQNLSCFYLKPSSFCQNLSYFSQSFILFFLSLEFLLVCLLLEFIFLILIFLLDRIRSLST